MIRLSSYRVLRERSVPLDLRGGDSDLKGVALVLWVGSVIRVVLELVSHQPFGVEATLALGCAVSLPWLIFQSRNNPSIAPRRKAELSVKKA